MYDILSILASEGLNYGEYSTRSLDAAAVVDFDDQIAEYFTFLRSICLLHIFAIFF